MIVAKDNLMRIEYTQGDINDHFKLVYTYAEKILNRSAGMIRQHNNSYTEPKIFVPKLTDQRWIIKAPYGKQIQLYTRLIGLLYESPCSKAPIDFILT